MFKYFRFNALRIRSKQFFFQVLPDLLIYIVVQLTAHVSLTGLPVLRTLYKPMSMNKSTNSQNCEFSVL